jgi:hypothetical protein
MRARTTIAALSALALAAAGLAVAVPAQAGAADEIVYGLGAVAPGGGTSTVALHLLDTATHDDTEVKAAVDTEEMLTAVSPDGTKIAYVVASLGTFGEALWVYDRVAHTTTMLASAADGGIGWPVWTPDGTKVLASFWNSDNLGGSLVLYPLTGTPVAIPHTPFADSWDISPSGKQVVFARNVGSDRQLFLVNLDGTSLTPLGLAARAPAWSHDGQQILVVVDHFTSTGARAGSVLETITPKGYNAKVIPASYHSSTIAHASWSPDDARIMTEGVQGLPGSPIYGADVMPADGSALPTQVIAPSSVSPGASFAGPWSPSDTSAPTMTTPVITLAATAASMTWPAVGPRDAVGVRIAVSAGATPPSTYAAGTKRVTVLGAGRSAAFTGLTSGATYSYSAWAFDGSGNTSTRVTGHFRLVSAAVLTAPAIASSASTSYIPVAYHSSGSGTAGVRIGYSNEWIGQGWSSWSAGPELATSGTYPFGKANVPVPAFNGANFRFRAGAVDAWGNVRWSTTTVRSAVPFDDRDPVLHFTGAWSHPATVGAWLGTTSVTRTGGTAVAKVSAIGRTAPGSRALSVVATTTPAGGSVRVYVDGKYVTTVSTRSAVTRLRQTVWTSASLTFATHTLKLVQVIGSGWFRLDAVAVRLG